MATGYLIEDMGPSSGDVYVCWNSLSEAQNFKRKPEFSGYTIYQITGELLGYDKIPETIRYGSVQGIKIKAQNITVASY